VRATAGLSEMVDQIFGAYNIALNNWAKIHRQDLAAENMAFSIYLRKISDKIDQTIAERNLAHEKARIFQDELDAIRGRLAWRLYQRITHIPFVRNLYIKLITPIWRWRVHPKKELKKPQ
jgi:hypothetical protein